MFSHDQLNRLMRDDKLPPRLVWEQSQEQLIASRERLRAL